MNNERAAEEGNNLTHKIMDRILQEPDMMERKRYYEGHIKAEAMDQNCPPVHQNPPMKFEFGNRDEDNMMKHESMNQNNNPAIANPQIAFQNRQLNDNKIIAGLPNETKITPTYVDVKRQVDRNDIERSILEHTQVLPNGLKVKSFECKECGGTFGRKWSLESHIQRKHR